MIILFTAKDKRIIYSMTLQESQKPPEIW